MIKAPWLRRGGLIALIWMTMDLLVPSISVTARGVQQSPNMRVIAHFPYQIGTDIDFRGDSVYLSEDGFLSGTIRVLNISRERPRLVAEFECGGTQNDVAAVGDSVIALGNHWGTCQGQPTSGVTLLDVTEPSRPMPLASAPIPGGTHTLTKHPTEPLIYTSGEGFPQLVVVNPSVHREYIVDVSDPERPVVVPTAMSGCHDISFHISRLAALAFCAAGELATEIWDVSDPLVPRVLARIIDLDIGYHHSAVPSPDGKFLVVGDETDGECSGAAKERTPGALSIYDISDPTSPENVSFINIPRGSGVCYAHNYNFVPGTRILVTSWFQGGVSVYDLSKPSRPREMAYFRPPGDPEVWSAYWYRGRIYTNGFMGAYALEINGL